MLNVSFQTYGRNFNLRLRLYKNHEVRYICANKILRGNFTKRDWNQRRQCFRPSAPMYELNNKALEEFRKPYDELAKTWDGSVSGFMLAIQKKDVEVNEDVTKLHWLISKITLEKKMDKHRDGSMKCTYESYDNTEKRLVEFFRDMHQNYYDIELKDITSDLVNDILEYAMAKRGYGSKHYVSRTLHAVFNWGDKMGYFDFNKLRGVRWAKKHSESVHKYQTLTNEQCREFIALKARDLPYNIKAPQWRWKSKLYHDFCIFILFSCQSPCDALTLKYSDIQTINGVDHFVFKRRKIAGKQSVACSVPINEIMRKIMKRWKSRTSDGYIFPVRTNKTIMRNAHDNNDIDKFTQRVNAWLKKVGPMIGVPFPLHNYVFRHTGITHYISKGVPIIYVANLAGTSVKNCEAIYYNNQADVTSRNMVLAATDF